MSRINLGPLIEPGGIHDNLTVWRQLHVRAIHRTRCRSFKVDTFAVVAAPMAGAFELVLAGFPIGCAAEVSAASVDDKHAIRRAVHPDAVFLLPLGIYTQGVVRGITNLEDRGGFEERTWKKKLKESDEPSAQETSDGSPDETPPPLVNFTRLGTDSRQTASRCCFGRTHGRRTNIGGCISATGSGCFRRVWLWFGRISFRARHAIPPGLLVLENNRRPPKAPPIPPSSYEPGDRDLATVEKWIGPEFHMVSEMISICP